MKAMRFGVVAVVSLMLVTGLVGGLTAQGQEARHKLREGELPGAEPALPGGRTTLGIAPDLSVFSVMKFAGTLKDAQGKPRTGAVGITFAFYSEQTGGAPLWLETQNIQLDSQGHYTALLGATKAEGLPINLFSSGEARWIGIQVGTEAELQRILLVSVPYALKAAEAETLGGRSADEFVLNEELEKQVQQAVETQVAESTTSLTVSGGTKEITDAASTFTDTNATQVVLVDQLGSGIGLRAKAPGTAVLGDSTATTGANNAVQGQTASTQGIGVLGLAQSTTGVNFGILGQTASNSGRGVFGFAGSTTGATRGLLGEVRSPDGIAAVFNSKAGGTIISGRTGALNTEVFLVDGSGNLVAEGSITSTSGTFTGNGLGLTSIPAGQLTGTIDDLRLSTNVPLLDAINSFSIQQNIDATTTVAGLQVTQAGTGFGVRAVAPGTAVLGVSTSTSTTQVNNAVRGQIASAKGRGIYGLAQSTTGVNFGILGQTASNNGRGSFGLATSTTGQTRGLLGEVRSPNGIAAVFNSKAGGAIISGRTGALNTEVFLVDGSGNLVVDGNITSTTGVFTGNGSGLTGITAGTPAADSVGSGEIVDGSIVDADVSPIADIAPTKILGTAATLGANTFTGTQTAPDLVATNTVTSGSVIAAGSVADAVLGQTSSATGTGVSGRAPDLSGATIGVEGIVQSASGTAGFFINLAGGKILSGNNFVDGEVFSVNGAGNQIANVTQSATNLAANPLVSAVPFAIRGDATATTGMAAGVLGANASPTGAGVVGWSTHASGDSTGVFGLADSTIGVGVEGEAISPTGGTVGVAGIVHSTTGVAGEFENSAGGKILSGIGAGFTEFFSVDGSGNLVADGNVTSTTGVFAGNGSGLTGIPTASDISGAITTHTALAAAHHVKTTDASELVSGFLSDTRLNGTVTLDTELAAHAALPNVHHIPTVDTTLTEGQVDTFVANNGFALLGSANTFTALNTFDATPTGALVGNGSVYLNPATAGLNTTLLGVAVGGVEQMRVDAEGDVFVPVTATVTAGFFVGNGSGLTALDPVNLSAGTAAINISGNAATATSAGSATTAADANLLDGLDSTDFIRNQGTLQAGAVFHVATGTVTGTMTAGAFVGDGSGLTNMASNATLVTMQAEIDRLTALINSINPPASHLWSTIYGSTGIDEGFSIALDSNGDIFLAGHFNGTVDFGGGGLTSTASDDVFLAKYSGSDGSHIWSKNVGGLGADFAQGVAVDSNGDVVIVGYYSGILAVFGGAPLSSAGLEDIFLAKYSGVDGTHLWSKSLGSTGSDQALSVAFDSANDVIVTGFFSATVDFGGGGILSAGAEDIFVAKFAGSTGAHTWSLGFGNTGSDKGLGVAASGSVIAVTGFYNGSIDLDAAATPSGEFTSAGLGDIFLAKLSSTDGSHVWSQSFGSTGEDQGVSVAMNAGGDVAIAGSFTGTVNFGGGGVASGGVTDVVVAKYASAAGAFVWADQFGNAAADEGKGVTFDGSGNVLATGNFQGAVTIGGIALDSGTGDDLLVVKYDGTTGTATWAKSFGDASGAIGYGIVTDSPADNVFVTGQISGTVNFGGGNLVTAGVQDIVVVKLRQ